jgi:hypothetical protein
MKIAIKLFFMIALVLGLILGTTAKTAQAAIGVLGDTDDNWTSGNEVSIDLEKNPAPFAWLQLIGSGVQVSAPGTICSEFRKGQFGWIAEVYQLTSGYWVEVPTTQGWLNGGGAKYMVCATAPSAGTYALFAYYKPPAEKKIVEGGPSMPICEDFRVKGYVLNEDVEGGNYTGFVIGAYEGPEDPTTWTYEILSYETSEYVEDPAVIISGVSGPIIDREYGGYGGYPVYTEVIQQMLIRLYTNTCYIDWEFIWS